MAGKVTSLRGLRESTDELASAHQVATPSPIPPKLVRLLQDIPLVAAFLTETRPGEDLKAVDKVTVKPQDRQFLK